VELTPEQRIRVKTDLVATKLAVMTHKEDFRRQMVDAVLNDRVDVKRELWVEELMAFIETIEKRLYLAKLAAATGQKEKEEVFAGRTGNSVIPEASFTTISNEPDV
jgi:hypothetical protein